MKEDYMNNEGLKRLCRPCKDIASQQTGEVCQVVLNGDKLENTSNIFVAFNPTEYLKADALCEAIPVKGGIIIVPLEIEGI